MPDQCPSISQGYNSMVCINLLTSDPLGYWWCLPVRCDTTGPDASILTAGVEVRVGQVPLACPLNFVISLAWCVPGMMESWSTSCFIRIAIYIYFVYVSLALAPVTKWIAVILSGQIHVITVVCRGWTHACFEPRVLESLCEFPSSNREWDLRVFRPVRCLRTGRGNASLFSSLSRLGGGGLFPSFGLIGRLVRPVHPCIICPRQSTCACCRPQNQSSKRYFSKNDTTIR